MREDQTQARHIVFGSIPFLAVLVGPPGLQADTPIDAGTFNFKDELIMAGNGRGDRDGLPQNPKPNVDGFVGDGLPDVFQAWMVMTAIQLEGDTGVELAFEDNNAEWITDVNAFSAAFGYYMAIGQGGARLRDECSPERIPLYSPFARI